MPHPILHRYYQGDGSDGDRDEPSPPSPALRTSIPNAPLMNDVIDLIPDSPPIRAGAPQGLQSPASIPSSQPISVVDLVNDGGNNQQRIEPSSYPSPIAPRMTANDLDDLFDEDPNSPPTHPAVSNPELHSPVGHTANHRPPAAMMEADAWRDAVQAEAKIFYDHFLAAQGIDTEYSCAVMPIAALLRVMQAVGTFIAANNTIVEGSIGSFVKLSRSSSAGEMPDFDVFQSTVDNILDEIIVDDVLHREAKKRRKEKRKQMEEARRREEEARHKERRREERRRAAKAAAERQAKKKRVEAIAQAKVQKRHPRVSKVISKRVERASPSKHTPSRVPTISFDDDEPPPPSRIAAQQAERDIIKTLEYGDGGSESEDIPRRNTRSFALKQKRIYEREIRKMLGPEANIDGLRRDSYLMQIRLAQKKEGVMKRVSKRKRVPDVESYELVEDQIATLFPDHVEPLHLSFDEDKFEEAPVVHPVRKRRRVPVHVEISDDEVEEVKEVHKKPAAPPSHLKTNLTATKAFQPKAPRADVPAPYLTVMTGKTRELEWGDMGDNFTVLGKKQRWEMTRPSVMDKLAQRNTFSFEEYMEKRQKQHKIKQMTEIRKRQQAAEKLKNVTRSSPPWANTTQTDSARQQKTKTKDFEESRPSARSKSDERGKEDNAQVKTDTTARVGTDLVQRPSATRRPVAPSHRDKSQRDLLIQTERSEVPKNGKIKSTTGLSRKDLRQLQLQEEDYREKEDPRHPDYDPQTSMSVPSKRDQDRTHLDHEGEERMPAKWLNQALGGRSQNKKEPQGHSKLQDDFPSTRRAHQMRNAEARERTDPLPGKSQDSTEHRRRWEAHQERLRRQREARVAERGKREHSHADMPLKVNSERDAASGIRGRREGERTHIRRSNSDNGRSAPTTRSDPARRESNRTHSHRGDRGNVYSQALANSERAQRSVGERIPRRELPELDRREVLSVRDPRDPHHHASDSRRSQASKGGFGKSEGRANRLVRQLDASRRKRDDPTSDHEDPRRTDRARRPRRPPKSSVTDDATTQQSSHFPAQSRGHESRRDPRRERYRDGDFQDRGRRGRTGLGRGGNEAVAADQLERSNKGFALLEKMGWKEGEGLGKDRSGRTEPLRPERRGGRSGLGG